MQQWTADKNFLLHDTYRFANFVFFFSKKNIFQAIIEFFCPGFSDDRRDDRV